MVEIELNGLIYVIEDELKLMDYLDSIAVEVKEA